MLHLLTRFFQRIEVKCNSHSTVTNCAQQSTNTKYKHLKFCNFIQNLSFRKFCENTLKGSAETVVHGQLCLTWVIWMGCDRGSWVMGVAAEAEMLAPVVLFCWLADCCTAAARSWAWACWINSCCCAGVRVNWRDADRETDTQRNTVNTGGYREREIQFSVQ